MEILEDLWYGQICPAEQTNDRYAEYRDLVALLERNESKLLDTLTPQQQEVFQRMKDVWKEMDCMTECAAFIKGFRLAVQLMAASV